MSDRVRLKTDAELLDHYLMADAQQLTHLGVLWLGQRQDRAVLRHAPVIQCIRYDEQGRKVFKRAWDDFSLNPQELIDAVWREVPDWRDSYDLKLMEREGSGYDRLYETLLASGRPGPKVEEGDDRVMVTVQRRIAHPGVIDLIAEADSSHQLWPRERTTLGLIAQHEALTAIQLAKALALKNAEALQPWLGRLLDFGLVLTRGRTKGTTYLVNPDVLKATQFRGRTSLRGIERHRLRELVLRDLGIYGRSRRGDIHARIGVEIPERMLRSELAAMVRDGLLTPVGEAGGRHYELTQAP